jgi:hypothetical protein
MARTRLTTAAQIDNALTHADYDRRTARKRLEDGDHVQHVGEWLEKRLLAANAEASYPAIVDWVAREQRVVESGVKRQTHAENRQGVRRKLPKYTSSGKSLEVSRRMVAKGENHEVRSVIHDLEFLIKNLRSQLPYAGRGSSAEALVARIDKLTKELMTWLEFVPLTYAQRVIDDIYR